MCLSSRDRRGDQGISHRCRPLPVLDRLSWQDTVQVGKELEVQILELGERIKSLTLIPSSGGAFEIRANGKLLHSKLDSGDWPDFDQIVRAIKKLK